MNKRKKNIIEKYYNDISKEGSFSSPTTIYRILKKRGVKITLQDIQEYLKGKESYTLHKKARRRFKRNKIILNGIGEQWSTDLMSISTYEKYNKHYKYVLIIIDGFSKKLKLKELMNKKSATVAKAFESILKKN